MSDNNKALFNFIRIAFTIMIILLVVYVTIGLASKGYDFGYRVFTESAMDEAPGKDVMVLVREDMSERDIAKLLEEKGLIRDSGLFYLQLKLSAYSGDLLPGVYTLNTSMKPKEMMVIMASETEDTESGDTAEESTEGTQAADTEAETPEDGAEE